MIPKVSEFQKNFKLSELPSNTFKLNFNENRIMGTCDGLEAMQQTIYLILNTERYEHIIFSWNYGIELTTLLGHPTSYVVAELERRISEALLQDSRIIKVYDFEFERRENKIFCTFRVDTIFGTVDVEKVVNY